MTTPPAAVPGAGTRWRRTIALTRRPIVQTFSATVMITGLNLITGAILARALGPGGRGELAAALLWPLILRFAVMLGLVQAIVYWAARPGTRLSTLAGTAAGMAAIQDVALIALGAVALPLILSGYSATTVIASLIYLGTVAVGTFGLYSLAFLNGTGRYKVFNVLRVLTIGLTAVAMAVLTVIDELTVTSAVLCYLAGVAPTAVIGMKKMHGVAGGIGRPDRPLARSLTSYGVRAQLSSVENPLYGRLDQLAISILLAPVQLGLYVVAFTVTTLIGFLSGTVGVVALPQTAASQTRAHRTFLARRYIGVTFLVSVAAAAALALAAEPLIELVFGGSFAPAVDTARILSAAAVLKALTVVGASVLGGLERPGAAGIAGAINLGVTAVGLAALIPPMGIEGAAVATLIGSAASCGWSLARIAAVLRVPAGLLLVPPRGHPPAASAKTGAG